MTERLTTKLLVIGGGPGGYVCAIRAAQLGLDTVLVEADRLGGTCLIRGCIPSKALIHAASTFADMTGRAARMGVSLAAPPAIDLAKTVSWKDGIVGKLNGGVGALLKRAKARVIPGWASFVDGKTCEVTAGETTTRITAEHVVIATGSLPVELPFLPFGGEVISSTEALDLAEVPRRLAVVGAGYIGLELGTAFRKLGAEVTVVEATDRILPGFDPELAAPVARWLKHAGVTVHLNAKATGREKGALLATDGAGAPLRIEADKILVTVGRKPNSEGWGRENLAVDMAGPFIKVDDTCATSMRNVWAIGDVTGEPMLEHRAAAQGEMVAEIVAGHRRRFDPVAIAAVCFTEPEIAVAGLSPDEARATGAEIVTGLFPYAANGRARSMEAADEGGFVRVVARGDDHRILGLAAVGAHVSDLSGEFALALEMGAVLEDIAGTIHVHPTLTEAIHEAALKALGHAIHI